MNKINNKTIYTTKFYADAALYEVLHSGSATIASIMQLACLLIGCSRLEKGTRDPSALLYLFLGILIIPLLFYVMPYLSAVRKFKKDYNEKSPTTITAEINSKYIHIKNNKGGSQRYDYNDLAYVKLTKSMLIIGTRLNKNEKIYLDVNSFSGPSYVSPEETCRYIKDQIRK